MSTKDSAPTDVPPAAALLPLIIGRWITQAITVAAELGIADALSDGPLTPAEIAARTGAHAPSVHRLLRALASLGIFAEDTSGRFHQTPPSNLLRSDVPGSLRGMARYAGSRASVLAWSDLATSIRTGEPAFRRVHGKGLFEHFAAAPDEGAVFDQAMHGVSSTEIPALLAAYDFADLGLIVDVGGGDGTLLCAILAQHPQLRGMLYDQGPVVERAYARLRGLPLAARIQLVDGSFFESVPGGGGAYLLKHILHDWSDDLALQILRHCRRAMPAPARLLIAESVIQPGNDPAFGKLLDLEMIAVTDGGRERTEAEFRTLLAAAGFRLTRVVPTAAPMSVIEAQPA